MKVKFREAVYDGSKRYEAGSTHEIKSDTLISELKERQLVDVLKAEVPDGRLPCPHCDKHYANEETLAAHIREKHSEKLAEFSGTQPPDGGDGVPPGTDGQTPPEG